MYSVHYQANRSPDTYIVLFLIIFCEETTGIVGRLLRLDTPRHF